MKIVSRYIFKEHLLPFVYALAVLMFVLLANFLLKTIDKFLGKGLDIGVLFEFMFLNLAWVLALAVPMAVLVATLMAFGRFSADNEINAMRSSGVSYGSLLFPSLLFGIIITSLMIFFNNWILPDMNHKARKLSADISRKRPDMQFEPGYFVDALPGNTILIGGKKNDVFTNITIFNDGNNVSQRTILADNGTVETISDGVILNLNDGVIHELSDNPEEYREIYFEKYKVVIPVDNLILTRKDSQIRGDREMTYEMIREKIAGYENKIINVWERIDKRLNTELKLNILRQHSPEVIQYQLESYELSMADSLNNMEDKAAAAKFNRRLKNLKRGINSDLKLIGSYGKSINKYSVELHKKFSIPVASIVFILIGAPLGIMAQKGGFAVSMAFSLGFFIIYWAFLIAGEEFADRSLLSPFLSMWLPNFILGAVGLFFCYRTSREQRFFNLEWMSFFKFAKKEKDDPVLQG
ncbi:MAG: YjgP/YjgQ family permease [Candidatus Marinimicrobia bacterium]|jgi:lipopolysaccharide export system permease protein|nr:YjgP/YjgQ family permease [Candidatus Neomarinimicrobiota bacterium]MBT3633877.1 YjgP/YjgQ family permease [Candidatus Neomarinimicrobiota bacterium]MBT3682873.1 YjgP/YjgQ family permease [Candidatus Neomarinimicrobiota bacterium]MBT3759940.1 YjgP/YjgQ family permease [Candidatus Neomarinimicrobiota bacterium]MBT3896034.1 YjgP/YjgQ family permease [Candidatus Neomarinimicrobiota bacterium]